MNYIQLFDNSLSTLWLNFKGGCIWFLWVKPVLGPSNSTLKHQLPLKQIHMMHYFFYVSIIFYLTNQKPTYYVYILWFLTTSGLLLVSQTKSSEYPFIQWEFILICIVLIISCRKIMFQWEGNNIFYSVFKLYVCNKNFCQKANIYF